VVDPTVALVGASHPAARALAIALEAEAGVERVLGLARHEPPLLGPKFEYVPVAAGERLAAQVQGARVVVLFPVLDASGDDDASGLGELGHALAGAHSAETVVLWSSGMVYGAHADNSLPLTEADAVRPNPDFPAAVRLEEMERLVAALDSGPKVVVLRAAPVWAPEWATLMGRSLQAPALLGVRGHDPVVQALHPDDAASALVLAVRGGLEGVYNVAPADWLPASSAARLAGRRRLVLTEPVARFTLERLWELGLANAPPGELHYLTHPWVLDPGRLRAAGWAPAVTSADAIGQAGSVERDGLAMGRVTVRRADLYRSVGAALATMAMMAAARRRLRQRSGGDGPGGSTIG
jgi:nucleoside-diphosphate-sugar epimerase